MWGARLQTGLVKTALEDARSLSTINQNRTLFGQISFQTIQSLSYLVRQTGFGRAQRFEAYYSGTAELPEEGDSSPLGPETRIQNWKTRWPWSPRENGEVSETVSEASCVSAPVGPLEPLSAAGMLTGRRSGEFARGRSRTMSVAGPLRDAYAEKQALSHMHQMAVLCDQTFRTRQKLLRYTGCSEQVRLKTVIDE